MSQLFKQVFKFLLISMFMFVAVNTGLKCLYDYRVNLSLTKNLLVHIFFSYFISLFYHKNYIPLIKYTADFYYTRMRNLAKYNLTMFYVNVLIYNLFYL